MSKVPSPLLPFVFALFCHFFFFFLLTCLYLQQGKVQIRALKKSGLQNEADHGVLPTGGVRTGVTRRTTRGKKRFRYVPVDAELFLVSELVTSLRLPAPREWTNALTRFLQVMSVESKSKKWEEGGGADVVR